MRSEELIREVILDLASEAKYVDLTRTTLGRGRLLRQRRIAMLTTVAAAMATVAVFVPYAFIGGLGNGRPVVEMPAAAPPAVSTPSPTPTPQPSPPLAPLPDGWIVGALTGKTTSFTNTDSLVYDRSQRAYVTVQYPEVIPAPSANVASVFDDTTRRYGILDIATRKVRWTEATNGKMTATSIPAWSPDSRYLAVLDQPKAGVLSALIIDTTDGSSRRVPIDREKNYCGDVCQIGWHDEETLSLPHAASATSEASSPLYDGTRLLSWKDGQLKDNVDLPGSYVSTDDWSADRRYVTLAMAQVDKGTRPRYVVFDTHMKRPVADSSDPLATYWVSATQRLQTSPSGVDLVDVDGGIVDHFELPSAASRHELVVLVKA